MPDETKTTRIKYVAELDKPSFQKIGSELDSQSKQQLKQVDSILKAKKDIIKSAEKEVKVYKSVIDKKRGELKEQQRINAESADALDIEKQRLKVFEERDKIASKQRQISGVLGDTDTSLTQVSSALSGLGVDAPILNTVAALPELAEGLANLPTAVNASAESIKVLATQSRTSVLALGAAGVGLAAFAGVIALASSESDKARLATERLLEAQRLYYQQIENRDLEATTASLVDVQRELRIERANQKDIDSEIVKLVGDGSNALEDFAGRLRIATAGISDGNLAGYLEKQSEAADRISELEAQETALLRAREDLTNATETLEEYEARRAEEGKIRARQFVQYANDVRALREFEEQTLNSNTDANERLLQSLAKDIDYANEQIEIAKSSGEQNEITAQAIAGYNHEIDLARQKIEILTSVSIPYTQQLDKEAEAKKNAEEASKNAEKKEEERQKKLIAKYDARQKSLDKLIQLEGQATDAIASFANKQAEILIDRTNRDADRLEDYNNKRAQDETQFNKELLKINRDGNKAIVEARQAVSSLDADYMSQQVKANQDYYDELRQQKRRNDLEDLQDYRDHILDLKNAEQSNSVLDFIRLENQFKNEQQKKSESRTLEDKERRDQLQATLDDNREAYLQRRQLLQQEVKERTQQLQQSIAEARNKYEAEQQLAQQAFELQQQRQQRDDQLADQRAQVALQKQLTAIDLKASAELRGIQSVVAATGQLEAVARRISSLAGSSSSTGTQSRSYSGSSALGSKSYERVKPLYFSATSANGGVGTIQAYANGGIVPGNKPQLAVVGDGPKPEAIIPFNKAKGLSQSLMDYGLLPTRGGGNGGVIVNAPINASFTVSDGELKAEISDVLQTFATDLETQIVRGLANARNYSGS